MCEGRKSRPDMGDISSIGSIRDCFNTFNVNIFDKPSENVFDVESGKKLNYILQHGYSFRHHERKHLQAKKSVDAYKKANRDFANVTMHNKSLMDELQPRRMSAGGDSLSMSMSSQNLYAELFNDRYRKLTQSIIHEQEQCDGASAGSRSEDNSMAAPVPESKVSEELNNAKRNRIYKELGLNLNLKEIFNTMDYNQLMKLKKLHVLYASRSKAKPTSGRPKAPTETEEKK